MTAPSSFDHTRYTAFPVLNKANRRWPSQQISAAPQWCSVDLRDGNQALVEPMSVEQKKQMWQLLVEMGFKQIEVGFPAASQPDFDFVRWLIEEDHIPDDVTIQVLVQARDELIERTYESLKGAKRAIVHVYNSTSPVQRERVFQLDKHGIVDIARRGAAKVRDEARRYPQTEWQFQYSPESFSSTEVEFAIEVCNAVIEEWQPTPDRKVIINLPATVEAAMPNVFADQIETVCEQIQQRESIIISIHTHNDRGCAVAAAELAILAGADRIEGTLLGNGERTGNMDIVTMAMNLYSQGIDPELDISRPDHIISTVEACTQIKTHPRHPWLGELVYTAFSGSHQDAIRKCLLQQQNDEPWQVAYLPINPADLGRSYQSVIRVNSQSGKGGASYLLEQALGVHIPRWMQIELAQPIQQLTEEQGGEVSTGQIVEYFHQQFDHSQGTLRLRRYQLQQSDKAYQIQLVITDQHQEHTLSGYGQGAIDAFADVVQRHTGLNINIIQFDEQAQDKGIDASAMTFAQANIDNKRYNAVAHDVDSLSSAFKALLSLVNQALLHQSKMAEVSHIPHQQTG